MKRLAPAALALAALALAALTVASPVGAAGPPNALSNATVSPTAGSPTTTFTFLVTYAGAYPANSVDALVAGFTVPLTRISGTLTSGRWRGTHQLPAGSWPVTFQADASQKNDPTLPGPTVVVTAPTPPPTPTAPPTPRPTATPRPNPTPTPAGSPLASPKASASSTATTVASVSPAAPGSSASAGASSTSPGGGGLSGGDVDQQLGRILTGGLVAIGLLAVVGFAAIWRDRRRREEELVLAPAPSAAPMPSAEPRPPAEWQRDFGLEDEPIGTIEYQPPGDEG
jgi:hypothetical protein